MKIDEDLLQQRLDAFNPEPLVVIDKTKTKESIEKYVIAKDENNIDLVKVNYLNVLNDKDIQKSCENVIRKYGVGTCGPRAFYGTTDLHLQLEERLAKFLETEEAIVYSYGFSTISSSIAAYCKRKDVVFVDENANFPILQGLQSSKSRVVRFDHNDPQSLRQQAEKIAKEKRPARMFLIAEAVSWKTGKILPLKEFLEVAERFKMRVFLEESYSIGILGRNGKGLTEHLDIEISRVDMIIATLETAIGSIGGFCAGSETIIEHQRLSGSGYIFSASLPTYLVQAGLDSIEKIPGKPEKIQELSKLFHDFLEDCGLEITSGRELPFKVFRCGKKEKELHEYCKENGVHFILRDDDSLVIHLNVALVSNEEKLAKIKSVIKKGCEKVGV